MRALKNKSLTSSSLSNNVIVIKSNRRNRSNKPSSTERTDYYSPMRQRLEMVVFKILLKEAEPCSREVGKEKRRKITAESDGGRKKKEKGERSVRKYDYWVSF
ncbi:hypothetical protein C5167_013022 [Papaver somniferum]|uniref:Uncharacterized protein n=1 Tax=Papaver somniferum TaxID=3469 RepID=A0A4Y7J3E6_PAPSO|nr:hypothetical protein C5167_013022 [Papaver somniferum]